ncbi:hypothetical protein F4780DRAFT_771841 [Xylariomycetidae sp. FL0641]|nr:hypothetical protein F4780DRAFT_771841 [Xylariomycetidae sp. FL0641]
MKTYTASEWLPSASGLGESPLYRASDDTFFFADIARQLVHSIPASSGSWGDARTVRITDPPPTFSGLDGAEERATRLEAVAGRADVLAAQTLRGFALLDPDTGALTQRIANVRHADAALDARCRLNDGAVDARGRWWATSMALDEASPVGRLWCLGRDGTPVEMALGGDAGAGEEEAEAAYSPVLNGPVFSPDGRAMYVADTPRHRVYRFDYDVEAGRATNRRLFVEVPDGGLPDGMAVDVEGHVWVAVNAKGRLHRYAPDGTCSAVVEVPGAKMTSCPVFGGREMKTLFITSIAAEGSTGHVYRVEVDVPGVERHAYRSSKA